MALKGLVLQRPGDPPCSLQRPQMVAGGSKLTVCGTSVCGCSWVTGPPQASSLITTRLPSALLGRGPPRGLCGGCLALFRLLGAPRPPRGSGCEPAQHASPCALHGLHHRPPSPPLCGPCTPLLHASGHCPGEASEGGPLACQGHGPAGRHPHGHTKSRRARGSPPCLPHLRVSVPAPPAPVGGLLPTSALVGAVGTSPLSRAGDGRPWGLPADWMLTH